MMHWNILLISAKKLDTILLIGAQGMDPASKTLDEINEVSKQAH